MPAPYSDDLRRRVVSAYLSGSGTYEDVAARFEVGRATVDRWVARYRRLQSVTPDAMGGDRHSKLDDEGRALLRALVVEQPDITRDELVVALASHGLNVSASCVQRNLERLALTRKKRRSTRPSETPKR